MATTKCKKCKGEGSYSATRQISNGGGLFGWRQECERCQGTGRFTYDLGERATWVFAALVAAYFFWQFFIR